MSLTAQGYLTSLIFTVIVVIMTWTAVAHIQHQKKMMHVYEVVLENGEVTKWSLPGYHVSGDKVHLRRDGKRLKAIIR